MATSLAKSIVKEFPARLLSSFYDGDCCRVNPVILMYHSINDYLNHRLVVKPTIFESQIKFLLDSDWEIVSMSQALSGECQTNENSAAKQKKKVVLTFDDGYEDNYTAAFDVLKKYNVPATIFLISDFVGTRKRFHWFQDGDNWAVSLNWDQIRVMQDFGIEFGSHTKTHPLLSTVNSDEVLFDEISGSREKLIERLGKIKYFCYPAGDYNARAKSMVEKAGYSAAVSVRPGFVKAGSDQFLLPRIEISGFDKTIDVFSRKITGCYIPFHKLLQAWQKRKKHQVH